MAYVFIDESGEFAKHDDNDYFLAASFTTGDPRRTEKRFRSWHHTRFPKFLSKRSEVKFSNKEISDGLRLRTLKYISDLDVRIHYTYLRRQNIPEEYRRKDRIEAGLLYTSVIGETLELYLPMSDLELRVVCDQRHLAGITQAKFKRVLKTRLLPELPAKVLLRIDMVDSTTNANIQIADWLAGALAKFLEKKSLGEECYRILRSNIVQEKELFEDYWEKKHVSAN